MASMGRLRIFHYIPLGILPLRITGSHARSNLSLIPDTSSYPPGMPLSLIHKVPQTQPLFSPSSLLPPQLKLLSSLTRCLPLSLPGLSASSLILRSPLGSAQQAEVLFKTSAREHHVSAQNFPMTRLLITQDSSPSPHDGPRDPS